MWGLFYKIVKLKRKTLEKAKWPAAETIMHPTHNRNIIARSFIDLEIVFLIFPYLDFKYKYFVIILYIMNMIFNNINININTNSRFYLQTDDERMSDFAQNIPLVLDMLDLLETNDFGHGQNLHGTVLFRNAITA